MAIGQLKLQKSMNILNLSNIFRFESKEIDHRHILNYATRGQLELMNVIASIWLPTTNNCTYYSTNFSSFCLF